MTNPDEVRRKKLSKSPVKERVRQQEPAITRNTFTPSPKRSKKSPPMVLPGFCDICWGKDGNTVQGLKPLRTCVDCGVSVHEECYGYIPLQEETTEATSHRQQQSVFKCWACQAVGKTFHVRDRDPQTNKRIAIQVQKRPTECCLCGTDNGNEFLHAMHPVYDDHGPTGRQLLLPPSKLYPQKRLAWAHTLCCNTISTLTGAVYGCTRDGGYDGSADVVDDDDSVNSALDSEDNNESIHHFAYVLKRNNKRDFRNSQWLQFIQESQQKKCYICGQDDRPTSVSLVFYLLVERAWQMRAGNELIVIFLFTTIAGLSHSDSMLCQRPSRIPRISRLTQRLTWRNVLPGNAHWLRALAKGHGGGMAQAPSSFLLSWPGRKH